MYFNETDFDETYATGKYLSGRDLNGETVRGRITDASMEDLRERDGGTKRRVIITVSGIAKPIVLNKTNAKTVAEVLGKNGSAWIGAVVEVSTVETSMGTGLKVRVLKPADAPAKPKAKADPLLFDDNIDDLIA
jgi:hypothetical protein